MSANLESSVVATGLEKVSFHSNSKESNDKEYYKKDAYEYFVNTTNWRHLDRRQRFINPNSYNYQIYSRF